MRSLAQSIQFQNHSIVPKIGMRGRLCLIWNDNLHVQVLLQSQSSIHALGTPLTPGKPWIYTHIYGPPHSDAKKNL